MTKDFVLELANIIPFDAHIETLKQLIQEYQDDPSEERKSHIYSLSMLLSMKATIDQKGVDTVTKDLNDIDKAVNFFKIPKN